MEKVMTAITTAFVTVNLLALTRLLTYQREGSSHKPGMSFIAYILIVAFMGQVVHVVFDQMPVCPWDLVISSILCTLVFRARGNVAKIVRLAP